MDTTRVDAMSQRYEGRAFIRPLDAGIVLLDAEGEPRVERWLADILERHGYSSYSEAYVTISVDVQPSQRADDDTAPAAPPPDAG
jgi:hypothetical protein